MSKEQEPLKDWNYHLIKAEIEKVAKDTAIALNSWDLIYINKVREGFAELFKGGETQVIEIILKKCPCAEWIALDFTREWLQSFGSSESSRALCNEAKARINPDAWEGLEIPRRPECFFTNILKSPLNKGLNFSKDIKAELKSGNLRVIEIFFQYIVIPKLRIDVQYDYVTFNGYLHFFYPLAVSSTMELNIFLLKGFSSLRADFFNRPLMESIIEEIFGLWIDSTHRGELLDLFQSYYHEPFGAFLSVYYGRLKDAIKDESLMEVKSCLEVEDARAIDTSEYVECLLSASSDILEYLVSYLDEIIFSRDDLSESEAAVRVRYFLERVAEREENRRCNKSQTFKLIFDRYSNKLFYDVGFLASIMDSALRGGDGCIFRYIFDFISDEIFLEVFESVNLFDCEGDEDGEARGDKYGLISVDESYFSDANAEYMHLLFERRYRLLSAK